MFSQSNSSVYVAVLVLHPLLQMKILPFSLEDFGTFPVGNRDRNVFEDTIDALPLIEANGLRSHDGVMYTSFYLTSSDYLPIDSIQASQIPASSPISSFAYF